MDTIVNHREVLVVRDGTMDKLTNRHRDKGTMDSHRVMAVNKTTARAMEPSKVTARTTEASKVTARTMEANKVTARIMQANKAMLNLKIIAMKVL